MSLKRSPFDFSRRQKWVAPPTLKFLSDNRRQTAFNTPSWPKDLDTKFHFNSHLHTSRPSLEKCLKGASIHVNVSFCTAFGIENLMRWKAAILWDVVSWMLSFALINGKKIKISSFAEQDVWKASLKPRLQAMPVRIWVMLVWREEQKCWSSEQEQQRPLKPHKSSPGQKKRDPNNTSVTRDTFSSQWSLEKNPFVKWG